MDTNNQLDDLLNVKIDETVREYLKTATTWARIIAILSFIGAGLSLLEALIGKQAYSGVGLKAVMVFFTMIVAAIMVVIYLFLYRFANNTSNAINDMNQELFNIGIGHLRTYFKIVGIIIIIGLSFFVLAFLFGGLGALMRGSF